MRSDSYFVWLVTFDRFTCAHFTKGEKNLWHTGTLLTASVSRVLFIFFLVYLSPCAPLFLCRVLLCCDLFQVSPVFLSFVFPWLCFSFLNFVLLYFCLELPCLQPPLLDPKPMFSGAVTSIGILMRILEGNSMKIHPVVIKTFNSWWHQREIPGSLNLIEFFIYKSKISANNVVPIHLIAEMQYFSQGIKWVIRIHHLCKKEYHYKTEAQFIWQLGSKKQKLTFGQCKW